MLVNQIVISKRPVQGCLDTSMLWSLAQISFIITRQNDWLALVEQQLFFPAMKQGSKLRSKVSISLKWKHQYQ